MNKNLRIRQPKAFGSYLRESMIMLARTRADVGRELPDVVKVPYQIEANTAALDEVGDSAAELAKIILAQQPESYAGERLNASEQLSNMLRQATGIAKAPFVADFARLTIESAGPTVLVGWHRSVYEIWAQKLKDLRIGWYTGTETPSQKHKTAELAKSGELDAIFLSLRSGAGLDGLQYTNFRTIIFGELDWSPAVHEQCIGRLQRDGQAHAVTAFFLVSDHGADPVMCDVLGIKREQLEGVRRPDGEVIEKLDSGGAQAKRLAEFYLEKYGRKRGR
jgi:hypothetical protein